MAVLDKKGMLEKWNKQLLIAHSSLRRFSYEVQQASSGLHNTLNDIDHLNNQIRLLRKEIEFSEANWR